MFDEIGKLVKDVLDGTRLPERPRAAVYSRLSNLAPDDISYSLDFQPGDAREYAEKHNIEIVVEYEDADFSGSNSRRDGFQRLRRDILARRIDIVIIHRIDRVFRNFEAFFAFIRLIKQVGVQFVSLSDPFDPFTPIGRLLLGMVAIWAEWPVWQTSTHTIEAKMTRLKRGLPNASYIFGYCRGCCSKCTDSNGKGYCPLYGSPDRTEENQRGKIFVPHPVEKRVVQETYSLYREGWSDRQIADHYNSTDLVLENGLKVKYRTKGRPGSTLPGEFTRDNIRDILTNVFYAGWVAHYPTHPLELDPSIDGSRPEQKPLKDKRTPLFKFDGLHQGIIDRSEWLVINQLRISKRFTPSNKEKPRRTYLLSGSEIGVGYCWECYQHDLKLVPLRGSTGGSGNQYYRCAALHDQYMPSRNSTILASKTSDNVSESAEAFRQRHSATLSAKKMDKAIVQMIDNFKIPPEWYETIVAYFLDDEGSVTFERNAFNLRSMLAEQKSYFRNHYIDRSRLELQSLEIHRKLMSLKPSSQPEGSNVIPLLENFHTLWEKMTVESKKALLHTMFEAILFDKDGNVRRILPRSPFEKFLNLGDFAQPLQYK